MGFNTVAFLLNDMMTEIERAPHAVAYALTHPLMGAGGEEWWRQGIRRVAEEHGERPFGDQALRVLPTFHADGFKLFLAGNNTIAELEWISGGRSKGSSMVLARLPEWWRRR